MGWARKQPYMDGAGTPSKKLLFQLAGIRPTWWTTACMHDPSLQGATMQSQKERHLSPMPLLRKLSYSPHLVNPTLELEKLVGAQGNQRSEPQPTYHIFPGFLPIITFLCGNSGHIPFTWPCGISPDGPVQWSRCREWPKTRRAKLLFEISPPPIIACVSPSALPALPPVQTPKDVCPPWLHACHLLSDSSPTSKHFHLLSHYQLIRYRNLFCCDDLICDIEQHTKVFNFYDVFFSFDGPRVLSNIHM